MSNEHDLIGIENEIDQIVLEIKNMVTRFNPLEILKTSYGNMLVRHIGKTSEFQHSFEDIHSVRMIDYVQSIIVSSKAKSNSYEEFSESVWFNINNKVSKLYSKLNEYHLRYEKHKQLNNPNFNKEYHALYLEAQLIKTNVRGHRYQYFDIEHLRDLLMPHDDFFQEEYNLSVEDFINGIERIQYSLTFGMDDTISEIRSLIDKTCLVENNDAELEFFKTDLLEVSEALYNRFFGYDLFDVELVTQLPRKLLLELSWKVGEEQNFFSQGEYKGWPLRKLPIEEKPFLNYEDKIYCFDYYSLFDNLYRNIQRLVFRVRPDYREQWNEKQKEISERLPLKLFSKLLPGAEIYDSYHYRGRTGTEQKKQWCEGDGLILFDDHLFVIEVKAGSFTYTHPSTDFKAFIDSIKSLAEKPYKQSVRFIDTLEEDGIVDIYNDNSDKKELLASIDISNFRHITSCSVTIDNFNEFTAKLDKLASISIELGELPNWNMSLDELRVYADYFESPSIFLHYVEQRLIASQTYKLNLDDELDHLGLYIAENHYYKLADLADEKFIFFGGFREELDNYYADLLMPSKEEPKKPLQPIPQNFKEIINVLEMQAKRGFTKVVSTFLDFDFKSRNEINNNLNTLRVKQLNENRIIPLYLNGENSITFMCKQDGAQNFNKDEAIDYIIATMLNPVNNSRLGLFLDYNKDSELYNVDFEFIILDNISPEKIAELQPEADTRAARRIQLYKTQYGIKKIGRNEKCPCGSGKKYKHCCGKNR